MSSKCYRVKDVALLSGVTVRTLHHYDRLGLLVPSRSDSGYRLYTGDDLVRLQQILVWRALGFPLDEIKRLLDDPEYDCESALEQQRAALTRNAAKFLAMIRSVDRTLAALKGGTTMAAKELFDGFDPAEHEEEARERWGDSEAYRESIQRTKQYSKRDWERIKGEMSAILGNLAEKMHAGSGPDAPEVRELVEAHRQHIDRWFYPCSPETHRGLADLYTSDERFAASIDAQGAGLARFLSDAIHTAAK